MFAGHDLGFRLVRADRQQRGFRATRIYDEIDGSLYSVHDLGQVALSAMSKLHRVNKPFEAGIAYSMHESGLQEKGRQHHILLLDRTPYRIQASVSDASGIGGQARGRLPVEAIEAVRRFLSCKIGTDSLSGGSLIYSRVRETQ